MPAGTGKGRAQDVTGQAMIVALGGGPPPVGGTGEGDFQDATAQAMLLLLMGGGGGAIISVATTADLAAKPTAPAPQGTPAFVQAGGGSYWAWYPTGSTPPAGAQTTAGNGGVWANVSAGPIPVPGQAPGTPAYNPAWYAWTDVWFDPVGGSDSNVGGSMGAPVPGLKTMAEVVRRYGSDVPKLVYGNSLTLHQLTAQTPGVDAFFFSPKMSGGTNYVYLATPTPVGAPFSPTTVTAKSQVNPGTDFVLNGALPIGIAVDQIVHNITRDSYAKVVSVIAGNARVTQPYAAAGVTTPSPLPVFVEDNGWLNTDSYQLSAPLACNMKTMAPVGGDVDAAFTKGTYWIQGVRFTDASGSPGASQVSIIPSGCAFALSLCTVDPYFFVLGEPAYLVNVVCCSFNSGLTVNGTTSSVVGGICKSDLFVSSGVSIDGDVIIHGQLGVQGAIVTLGAVHIDAGGSISCQNGAGVRIQARIASAIVWGAGSCDVDNGRMFNGTGGPWVSCLKLATLTLDGSATASSFNGAALGNPYTPGVAVTSANLDAGGGPGWPGLQNPLGGGRYAAT